MKSKNFIKAVMLLICSMMIFAGCKKNDENNNKTPTANQLLIDQLKTATDSVVQTTHVPGVVALVVDHKRGIDWLYAAGKSDVENNLPMDVNHVFRIGSHTKTMTMTVLLQLVDEGHISLGDKLSKYFPSYPKADAITISMLLTMKTGIFNYSELEVFGNAMINNPAKVWQPQELIDLGFSHDFDFEPGTSFHYSNTNTFIIGQLIEKITGNPLETEINRRILQPLNLNNTGFLTTGIELPGYHGRGYETTGTNIYTDVTEYYDVSWAWAAGAAYSTPRELQKYVERLVGGGYLSNSLQQKRLTEEYHSQSDFQMGYISYGLGMMRCGSFYGHGGDLPGYSNCTYHSNEKNCTIIIYFNRQDDYPSAPLFLRFLDILYGNNY